MQRVVERVEIVEDKGLLEALRLLALDELYIVEDDSLAVAKESCLEYESVWSCKKRVMEIKVYGKGSAAATALKQLLANLLHSYKKLLEFREKAKRGEIAVEYVLAAWQTYNNVKNQVLKKHHYAERYAEALGIHIPDTSKSVAEELEDLIARIAEDAALNVCSCPEG